jgi:predicted acetyltransferase
MVDRRTGPRTTTVPAASPPVQLITPGDRPVVERLWQLYAHDLSEFRGAMPDHEGLFRPGRLPSYFSDADRCGYLIRHGSAPAGFALVRGISEGPRVMGEYFVVRAARRQGVGREAAMQVLRTHPGSWEIPFQEQNPGAARFWRRVAEELAAASTREERRPVPGKPDVPADIWLMLSVPAVGGTSGGRG